MKLTDPIWLVKSGGRVLGPYKLEEVENLLRSKELHLVDEICEPTRRWMMIRDHSAYREVLDRLRQAGTSLDESPTQSGSVTDSLTESLHAPINDDITEDISDYQSQLKEIVYENVNDSPRSFQRPAAGRFQSINTIDEAQIRAEAERGTRWMWALTATVLLSVVLIVGTKRLVTKNTLDGVNDAGKVGLSLYQDGDYASALTALKRAHNERPDRKELWLPLAVLLVQVDGQTVEAKRLLKKVLDEKTDTRARALTGLGLAQLNDGETATAAKTFEQAELADGNFLVATANRGVVALAGNDYAAAKKAFDAALNGGLTVGSVLIQTTVANVSAWRTAHDKALLADSSRLIRGRIKNTWNYQQELRLVELYLGYLRGEIPVTGFEGPVRKILDVDPSQTEDFRQPPLLAQNMADWRQLGEWCRQLVEAGGERAAVAALEALCLYKQGQIMAAKRKIEKAVNQSPKDPLFQALYAHILRLAGFSGEASVALGRAIEFDRKGEYLLPVLMQARFCAEREDWECANTFWMKVLQLEPRSPAAKVGLAQVYLGHNSPDEAQRLIQEATDIAPDYRPLLRLKRQVAGHDAP